eukprot:CAMPEP_0182440386 /NCGR_PEP_ID=MMETSP1167-20130531/87034_1 /TAXON_ID=2988 /ORGANISM="Mallomonas Sp, Strain CCMP3275" /LENGTH=160 /DNA_ID=CAMNT_0024634331 /DNA_START=663 /DNA_END=1143 /DNA_ORIENTATION=-
MFTGESAMEHAEVDVNDPDFWKKVLPDLVTPDMMLIRLEEEIGEEEEEEEEIIGVVEKFWKDLSQMMLGMLDLQRRGQLPDRQKASCMKLLLRISLRSAVFDSDQCTQAKDWLAVLEGTRNRRNRLEYMQSEEIRGETREEEEEEGEDEEEGEEEEEEER